METGGAARHGEGGSAAERGKTPLLERLGLRFLERRAARLPPVVADDEIHFLNPREQSDLRRISRNAVIRAGVAGALSALSTGLAELLAEHHFGLDPNATTLASMATFWGLVGGVTILATACELGFLYFDALRSVHELARAAGLSAFRGTPEAERNATASALARAALEMPNPPRGLYEIDPHREVAKIKLVFVALLYKLKVGLTNFLIKAVLRRLLGRAFLRVTLLFVAVPVTAAWNAAVAWWIIRQARLRVMGPSAARDLVGKILGAAPELSAAARVEILAAVAGSIVRTHDMHPNLIALFEEVRARVGDGGDADLDDTRAFVERLGGLKPGEQDVVLQILAVAAVLDGRLTGDERKLLREARIACSRDTDLDAVEALRRRFVRGQSVDDALVAAIAARAPGSDS